MRKSKGFTIIEILVVIAIVGLFSSLVLLALKGVRNRAKDARIQTDLHQLRTSGEIYYSRNGNSYTGLSSYTDIPIISDDITAQGSVLTLRVNANGTGYCAYSQLVGASGKYWCADNKLNLKQYDAIPSTCASGCESANSCACQ